MPARGGQAETGDIEVVVVPSWPSFPPRSAPANDKCELFKDDNQCKRHSPASPRCYDFLFIAGQLYVDEANERMRGAAQGFLAFILWGVGAFVGTMLAGWVMARHELSTPVGSIEHDWEGIWMQPALGAMAVLIVFLISFREPGNPSSRAPVPE